MKKPYISISLYGNEITLVHEIEDGGLTISKRLVGTPSDYQLKQLRDDLIELFPLVTKE